MLRVDPEPLRRLACLAVRSVQAQAEQLLGGAPERGGSVPRAGVGFKETAGPGQPHIAAGQRGDEPDQVPDPALTVVLSRRHRPARGQVDQAVGEGRAVGAVEDVFEHEVPVYQPRVVDATEQGSYAPQHLLGALRPSLCPGSYPVPAELAQVPGSPDRPGGQHARQVDPFRSPQASDAGEDVVGHRQTGLLEATVLAGLPFDLRGPADELEAMVGLARHPVFHVELASVAQPAGVHQRDAPPKVRGVATCPGQHPIQGRILQDGGVPAVDVQAEPLALSVYGLSHRSRSSMISVCAV